MKVAHAEAHVLSTQGLEEKQVFKIRTNAHAFRLLSSGLYSDKIAAVIREIGCNAHDAHIAAGCAQTPFHVKLPNAIDNQFYIRDFGPGLSHEEVMNLYTTYFASTKQDSNDFTGAFGLGSKSPFSYTDSFTITSRHGGVSRVYSAHIGNDGAPNIAKMGESPCDDTGIEISFPVSANDFSDFRYRAQSIYQFFDPLPKIIGGEQIKPLELVRDFGDYAFIKEDQGVRVKMGNVCYPVIISKLSINSAVPGDTALNNNMANLRGVLLRFKIGDVQVAASREELQYDDAGKAFIKEALKKVMHGMCHELEKLWEDTLKEDTLANRIKFHTLSDQSRRGFWISDDLLQHAKCKDPVRLMKALNQKHEVLPAAATCSTYFYITKTHRGTYAYGKPGGHIYYRDNMAVPAIVYGCEPHARDRVKEAVGRGDLELPVILVVPHKADKGTIHDVDATVTRLEKQMGRLEMIKLGALPITVLTRKALKKGQLPPLPQDLLDIKPPVYVNQQVQSNWGNNKSYWNLDANTVLDRHAINMYESCRNRLGTILPIPPIAKLTKMQIIRNRIEKRPEWVDLKTHMTKLLNDPASIAALKTAVGNFKFKLDLTSWRQDSAWGLLENLVFIADHHQVMYKALEPVLTKYNLKKQVDEVLKNSKTAGNKKPIELVNAYKEMAQVLGIQVNVPEFDAPMIEVNKNFPAAARLPWRVYKDLWEFAPDRLPDVLDQLLKKG